MQKVTNPSKASASSDSRKASIDRLLDAAETLLGLHGLDGVSLRQIGAAAGSANNFAVQYHFGDIGGLVQAILERRMPAVDARQAALLEAVEAEGRATDNRALINAFLRPVIEQVNGDGERAYARFISALLRSPEGRVHCKKLLHLTPATVWILEHLERTNPALSRDMLEERLRWLAALVFTSVFNRVVAFASPEADALLIDDVLDVAAAGLSCKPKAVILTRSA